VTGVSASDGGRDARDVGRAVVHRGHGEVGVRVHRHVAEVKRRRGGRQRANRGTGERGGRGDAAGAGKHEGARAGGRGRRADRVEDHRDGAGVGQVVAIEPGRRVRGHHASEGGGGDSGQRVAALERSGHNRELTRGGGGDVGEGVAHLHLESNGGRGDTHRGRREGNHSGHSVDART